LQLIVVFFNVNHATSAVIFAISADGVCACAFFSTLSGRIRMRDKPTALGDGFGQCRVSSHMQGGTPPMGFGFHSSSPCPRTTRTWAGGAAGLRIGGGGARAFLQADPTPPPGGGGGGGPAQSGARSQPAAFFQPGTPPPPPIERRQKISSLGVSGGKLKKFRK